MNLKNATESALALTGRLQEALNESNWDQFAIVLDEREAAMVAFQKAHQAASDSDREHWGGLINTLQQQDTRLQAEASVALTEAGDQMRASVGATLHYNGSYGQEPDLACIDRKA
ncbi:MAG: hypothetical protein QNL91_16195 [Candidatus Krumholzibacteria bacterium]|nr:hypothetical protein [Candidatus Krumholzibacteria bacterium]